MSRIALLLGFLFVSFAAHAERPDEPGIESLPTAPPSAARLSANTQPPDVLARAERECTAGKPCPYFAEIMRRLAQPGTGVQAAALLGALADPRAVLPLAQLAVYGAEPELRQAGEQALRRLVQRPAVRPLAVRLAGSDPDPAICGALAQALSNEPRPRLAASPAGSGSGLGPGPGSARPTLTDPDPTRVIYGPTAFTQRQGLWSWTIYDLAYWKFDYGVTDNFEVSLHAVPPILVVAAMPQLKLSVKLGEQAALGLVAGGGIAYPYMENEEGYRVGIYGGGPVLTIGNPDLLLNLGVQVYGVTLGKNDEPSETNVVALPNLGVGWRFARRLKLNAELYAPVLGGDFEENGKIWVLLYGLRIFDQRIYGDINFVIPFYPDFWDVMQYAPIGFPLLAFGFQW